MNKLFDDIQHIPLSGSQIYKTLDGKTKILRYKDLLNYNNIDDVLKPYNNIVLLYESMPRSGHWVCVIKHKDTIEYFDPYGLKIDEILKYIKPSFRKISNQDFPYLSYLLYKSKYNIIYNNKKLQEKNNKISTCGRHIISRIILKDIPLKKYINIFKTEKKVNADDKVSFLTSSLHQI